jgi:putative ubiquitin-RnfH superfamily antitoxin RatB of RatAB toxin-antitoxin module
MALSVEVVYARPGQEDAVTVTLSAGATLGEAVAASRILERHPELEAARLKIGVYGKSTTPEAAAADGDRVEIYRELEMDPKEARRRRALKKRAAKR